MEYNDWIDTFDEIEWTNLMESDKLNKNPNFL